MTAQQRRNRWKTARERDRRKARHDVDERVKRITAVGDELDDDDDAEKGADDGCDYERRVQPYLRAIERNASATFSLTALSKHHRLLSTPVPCRLLSRYKVTTLCTSRYGRDVAEDVLRRLFGDDDEAEEENEKWGTEEEEEEQVRSVPAEEAKSADAAVDVENQEGTTTKEKGKWSSGGRSLTPMEYAALLGQYKIVGCMLVGGIDPTVRGYLFGGEGDDDSIGNDSESSDDDCADIRGTAVEAEAGAPTVSLGALVAARFHDLGVSGIGKGNEEHGRASPSMPLTLKAHVVRCVVWMRLWGAVACSPQLHKKDDVGRGTKHHQRRRCAICAGAASSSSEPSRHNSRHRCGSRQQQQQQPPLLNFGAPCRHSFCERCLWTDLLANLDSRTDGDVVRCPVCGASGQYPGQRQQPQPRNKPNERDDNDERCWWSNMTPEQRRIRSLSLYRSLPETTSDLRSLPSKRKPSPRNPIHSTWDDAIRPKVGSSRDVRTDRFFRASRGGGGGGGSIHAVRGCLRAGVDVDCRNEYDQTPLYVACWGGNDDVVRTLLEFGAFAGAMANGELSCRNVAVENGRWEAVRVLDEWDERAKGGEGGGELGNVLDDEKVHGEGGEDSSTILPCLQSVVADEKKGPYTREEEGCGKDGGETRCHRRRCMTLRERFEAGRPNEAPPPKQKPVVVTLIDPASDHPGAGSCIVDGALSDHDLDHLVKLWRSLPVESCDVKGLKKTHDESKSSPCSDRSYFCDAEGYLCQLLSSIVGRALQRRSVLFPHLRFLCYRRRGSRLAPHVDLCRVDAESGERSTHTFILYLTDCAHGGQTSLLAGVSPDDAAKVLARVAPRRGRVLLFPHSCPHEGAEVKSLPKVLLRGEMMIL